MAEAAGQEDKDDRARLSFLRFKARGGSPRRHQVRQAQAEDAGSSGLKQGAAIEKWVGRHDDAPAG
jgi:hypothetical protein